MSDSCLAMPSTRHARVTISLCFLAAMCDGFDVQTAGVAAAGMRAEFGPSPLWLGIVFAASGAGLLLGSVAGGRLADRIGRKPVLVGALAAFGLSSLLTTLAGNIQSLSAMRLVTGLGLGAAMPNLIALTADVATSRSRSGSIAVTYVGLPLGGAVAGLIASGIALESWRRIFLCGGVAPLLLAPLLAAFLAPAPGVPLVSGENSQASRHPLHAMFSGGRARTTLLIWLGFLLIVLTLHLLLNWLPLLLMDKGLTKSSAGVAQAAFNAGGSIVALFVGALLDSRARRPVIAVSVAVLPAVLIGMAFVRGLPGTLIALTPVLGGAVLAQQVILFAVASAAYPSTIRGTALGAAIGVGRLGSLIGPLFAAWLITGGKTSSQVLIGILPIVMVAGVSVVLLGWQKSTERPAAG
jgi:MFS transporter, AAHS family, 3-hydroxyphenylpropionic acid transporter